MVVLVVENKPRTAVTPSTARPRTCPGHFVRPNLEQSAMHPAQHYAAMPIQPFDMRATFTDEQRRVSYALYFLDVPEAPLRSEWGGINGAISTIVREFRLPSGPRAMAERVLIDLTECYMKGEVYCGARKAGSGDKSKPIFLESMEIQIAADNIKVGLGLTQTNSNSN